MPADLPILSIIIFLPLVGAIFIALQRQDDAGLRNARNAALWTTLFTFGLSLFLWFNFETGTPKFQFVEKYSWIESIDIIRIRCCSKFICNERISICGIMK